MYIISIGDNETEELYDVFVCNMQEFTDVIDYIKMHLWLWIRFLYK